MTSESKKIVKIYKSKDNINRTENEPTESGNIMEILSNEDGQLM